MSTLLLSDKDSKLAIFSVSKELAMKWEKVQSCRNQITFCGMLKHSQCKRLRNSDNDLI